MNHILPTGLPNYCIDCGCQLEYRHLEGRIRAYCSKCDQPIYRNAKPCAGVLVIDEIKVLLVQRTQPPAVGTWSVPAGYLEIDEPPKVGAVRELNEETGLTVSKDDISLFTTKLVGHDDGTHVLVLLYTTVHQHTTGSIVAGSDAADARFWDLNSLSEYNEKLEPGYEELFRQAVEKDGYVDGGSSSVRSR